MAGNFPSVDVSTTLAVAGFTYRSAADRPVTVDRRRMAGARLLIPGQLEPVVRAS
jgi:hypothetical protein